MQPLSKTFLFSWLVPAHFTHQHVAEFGRELVFVCAATGAISAMLMASAQNCTDSFR